MKLNARILHLAWFIYNLNTILLLARHTHISTICTRLILCRSTWHNPFDNPLAIPLITLYDSLDNPPLPEDPFPVPESLLLTWNPSFACGAIPVHSVPRLLVY
jgi:hypothetical protein